MIIRSHESQLEKKKNREKVVAVRVGYDVMVVARTSAYLLVVGREEDGLGKGDVGRGGVRVVWIWGR